jgi:hypothetical protein
MKIEGKTGNVIYVQNPKKNQNNSGRDLRYQWNQIFTTE